MVRTAAILVTVRTILPPVFAAILATVLAAIFAAVFSAVFASVFAAILAARGLVGLAGDGGRGQQGAGYEQGTEQL